MAFVQSLDFFHHVEKHQATLLKAIPRGEQQNPEVQEVKQEPVTSSQVVAAIDKIVQEVLERLSKDEAPVLLVENRSNWNNIEFTDSIGLQMAKNCTTRRVKSNHPKSAQRFALTMKILSVIYKLVQTNTYATKRDIFYENVQLYGSQATVDNIVTDISCMLKVPRRSLHILSTSKGCVAGNLLYIEEDGTKVDCSGSTSGALVPSNVEGVTNLRTVARFILIIEKDATFQRLLDDDFCGKCGPCILITGKGVPDLNTRLFVRKMWDTFQIPIFTLVDADPHGIEIMCIYKYGSVSMSFEAHNLTVPSIAWLGLLPSDIERLHVPAEALIPLSALDQRKLQSLQKRPYLSCQPLWKQELEIMTLMKMKAEIQALTFLSPTFLTSVYLPNKLEYGGWI
ncbi:meiotic recombination protein SPO11 isoform X1 [Hyla sarda]|uniref:meiotic recombination protein SPO11 isoform X1 n=1 Tax=Hyla sarda TaxID=327740 RepID=UPI0024C26EE8|nr:meiotic recombination protein SPO11 isoform X1 [Hyla sarda]XP_056404936.1 meiotic recombination protein SPO11 isoform X1 [Hyla sarda]XP_056404937.1 meiotic recombination protein SPO11 isoform X1 [Hyla sarda]XP_056404938.1 meiotic recombination protein SPO11 isoform X1 [Hyla sarda]XP_056404939.1 meiotic recombination protein SPO11 isoform X1 [Hyla sarda]XP_056404940.1 meiotic recombination protein SPO11 isoform X1 [Hyla sarda]XP_056404941.1 meiotic recombination protein SPO11 isoform X1 [Hy